MDWGLVGILVTLLVGFKWKLAKRCVMWLWRQAGKGMSWSRKHSLRMITTMGPILPKRRYKALADEVEARKDEVTSLQEKLKMLEQYVIENRYLHMESRRNAYVRLCRKLAPTVNVSDHREPRLLVTLPVPLLEDGDHGYFSLSLLGNIGDNKWAADVKLSGHLRGLLDLKEQEVLLRVVFLDGGRYSLSLRRHKVAFRPWADNTYRAVITLSQSQGMIRVGDEMNALAECLMLRGSVGSIITNKGSMLPRGLDK